MKKIAENMKTLRRRMGLMPRDFGELCGCTSEQILDYENGETDVPCEVAYRLADSTNATLKFLMTGEEDAGAGSYTASFRVYNEADRKTIVPILVSNGYDVGQHKEKRKGGKAVDYYIHITDNADNIESSR